MICINSKLNASDDLFSINYIEHVTLLNEKRMMYYIEKELESLNIKRKEKILEINLLSIEDKVLNIK